MAVPVINTARALRAVRDGSRTSQEVAAVLGWSTHKASGVLSNLRKAGWIRAEPDRVRYAKRGRASNWWEPNDRQTRVAAGE